MKLSESDLEVYKRYGKERAKIETNLLLFLFQGFSEITLTQDFYRQTVMINYECSLDRYTELVGEHVHTDYLDLTSEGKEYYNLIIALNGMCNRGLLEKKSWFIDDFSPEDGVVSLNGKILETDANSPAWLARALANKEHSKFSYQKQNSIDSSQYREGILEFYSLHYEFTEKGYDVALTIQKHTDEKMRSDELKRLQQQALEISASSAKTAEASRRIARLGVIAAYIIGGSSLCKLVFDILESYCL